MLWITACMAYDGLLIHTIRTDAIAVVVEQGGGVRTRKYCENSNQRNKSV